MNTKAVWISCVWSVLAGALTQSVCAEGSEDGPKSGPCVEVTTEARFNVYAYDHIVKLKNTCEKASTCSVATDVNPTPITVELAPKEEKSVVTFSHSPSASFKADVSCKEHG